MPIVGSAELRVLVVAPQPFFQERGTPIATRLLIETLCRQGHQVDLLTYHEGQDIEVAGLRILRIPPVPGVRSIPIGFSWKKIVCDAVLSVKLMRHLRKEGYDVIHAVEESVFSALLARRRGRASLVYDMDSSMPEQLQDGRAWLRPLASWLGRFERRAIGASDLVLAVCADLGDRAEAYGTGTPIRVIPDIPLQSVGPVALGEDLRASLDPDRLLALYVGNLETYQGVELLLRGLRETDASAPIALVVIGGTAQAVTRHRELAAELGVADRVTFIGPRPLAQLGSFLTQADILVSPRLSGGNTPMKIYSYLASGTPILATRIRSHTQVLDDSCAFLVEPTAADLARGLAQLAAQADLRRELGQSALRVAETKFSREQFDQSIREAYEYLETLASA